MAGAVVTRGPGGSRVGDLLALLGHCTDSTLFRCIVLARMCFVMYMICCYRVVPLFTGRPSAAMTAFDTSAAANLSPSLVEVTRWDVIHFDHISTHGYTHESNFAFFPLMPLVIHVTRYLLETQFPFLGTFLTVPDVLCGVNIMASAAAGVLLRRITTLTFVGKEGLVLQKRSELTPLRFFRALVGSGKRADVGVTKQSVDLADATLKGQLRQRWRYQAVGTMLDTMHIPLEDENGANEVVSHMGKKTRALPTQTATAPVALSRDAATEALDKRLRRRWRFVGATTLAWVLTPSMVFTVALYTESLFALFTFAGIYSQIRPSEHDERVYTEVKRKTHTPSMPTTAAAGTDGDATEDDVETETHFVASRETVETLCIHSADTQHVYQLRQQYLPSSRDILSVACFCLTSLTRSNGFVNVGFLWYPVALQVLWPGEYQWRWRVQYASLCHALRQSSEQSKEERAQGVEAQSRQTSRAAPTVVSTVRLASLPTRWPHPVRVFWLCVYTAILAVPYVAMNYFAYTRFFSLLSSAEQAALSGHFWRMYAHIQAKYWDCGPLHAYSLKNIPNVLVALPMGFLTVATSVQICRGYKSRCPHPPTTSFVHRAQHLLHLGLQSSCLTLLWVLALIAFTVMHIQVVNRFVMGCPAPHWLIAYWWVRWPPQSIARGRQRGARGWDLYGPAISFILIAYIMLWNTLGGYFFPNHLPWT